MMEKLKHEVAIKPMKPSHHTMDVRPAVVIVEPDAGASHFYEKTLRELGDVDIECVTDGFSGLIKIAELKPVMIISNLEMAKFDGLRMINILDNDPVFRWTTVIVITDLSSHEISMRGGLPKNAILLHKPISVAALEYIVVTHFPEYFCHRSGYIEK
jgi:CheY-like chemotaxis protein